MISHDGTGVFAALQPQLEVARYHSLIVDREAIKPPLEVTAWTDDGVVMALRHTEMSAPLVGVQFHPESFLTPCGPALMANFLRIAGISVDASAIPCDASATS